MDARARPPPAQNRLAGRRLLRALTYCMKRSRYFPFESMHSSLYALRSAARACAGGGVRGEPRARSDPRARCPARARAPREAGTAADEGARMLGGRHACTFARGGGRAASARLGGEHSSSTGSCTRPGRAPGATPQREHTTRENTPRPVTSARTEVVGEERPLVLPDDARRVHDARNLHDLLLLQRTLVAELHLHDGVVRGLQHRLLPRRERPAHQQHPPPDEAVQLRAVHARRRRRRVERALRNHPPSCPPRLPPSLALPAFFPLGERVSSSLRSKVVSLRSLACVRACVRVSSRLPHPRTSLVAVPVSLAQESERERVSE